MKFKKIVGFGDSWMYGDELECECDANHQLHHEHHDIYRMSKVFGGLISKHYNVDFDNRGHNGASLQSMMWEFERWLKENRNIDSSLVLFGLTHPVRTSWWPEKSDYIHNANLNPKHKEYVELNKHYQTLCGNAERERVDFQLAIRLFDGVCSRLKITCLQFNIFDDPNVIDLTYNTTINPNTSLVKFLKQQEKIQQQRLFKSRLHPNEVGHQMIADLLIEHIDIIYNNEI